MELSKTKTLHPKIQELKATAPAINTRALSVNAFGSLVPEYAANLDKRIVEGYLLIWGSKNLYREIFMKGCCAKSISDMGPQANANYQIKFLNQHSQHDPLSLFEVLEEDDKGLRFKTKPLDDVASADRVITQLRSGTLNNFSPGWDYVWDKMEYDEKQDAIIIKEIKLYEGSVVSIPAELNTYAIRSKEVLEGLHDEIDDFINTLPRKDRLQARHLFARQTSLINLEPLKERAAALQSDKPNKVGIDYSWLLKQF